jgi:hypothetical protein
LSLVRSVPAVLFAASIIGAAAPAWAAQPAPAADSQASNPDAQARLAARYRRGDGVAQDYAEARRLYGLAAAQKNGMALRELGEMNMAGEGARRDDRKAVQQWKDAAFAGDRHAPILVADHLFTKVTGIAPPTGPGQPWKIKRSMPLAKVVEAGRWYQVAIERDDRPEVQQRAEAASVILQVLMKAAGLIEERRR